MSPNVECEMVGSCESSRAVAAFERFCPTVFPDVSGQLVRPDKCFVTILHSADEGSLSGVDPQVGLQVGALLVPLLTVLVVTHITSRPSLLCLTRVHLFLLKRQVSLSLFPPSPLHLHHCPRAHQSQAPLGWSDSPVSPLLTLLRLFTELQHQTLVFLIWTELF